MFQIINRICERCQGLKHVWLECWNSAWANVTTQLNTIQMNFVILLHRNYPK